MAYGDYAGANKPNKGYEGGACNRTRCQVEPALWFNYGTKQWYCEQCKIDIGDDPFNKRDWEANYQAHLGHPMFETREQMDARVDTEKKPDLDDLYKQNVVNFVNDLHPVIRKTAL